ncbi:winged helix-turn-helix domain-containing protein [Streptomyces sp. NA04227]|uniref:AfsR/SARP family transcriptional regulator n=1 Tax=Streptomyces sp. NA04227 TaxID=2742136 RepID=UPI001591B805|nr:BTAD domain-containing putative transcriptional regulator [Streptomyces sp. NA04227]QKW09721.1 winged helix-turn-helix domain-containing protein [Streptomyces sp. NA04227]
MATENPYFQDGVLSVKTAAQSSGELSFHVLGPLRVRSSKGPLPLGPARQRAVLSALLLAPGQMVSAERLADAVWPAGPPSNVLASLHSYVSRLRRQLEPDCPPRGRDRILRRELHGYVLAVEQERVDICRFERLLRDGRQHLREGRFAEAGRLLAASLSLWRGAPYAELGDYEPAVREAARLEELRLMTSEALWEAELSLGRDNGTAVAELAALCAKYPNRERLGWLLMVALCEAGRQAEAVRVYHRIRRVLAQELGVDPGRELRVLFTRILRDEDVGRMCLQH